MFVRQFFILLMFSVATLSSSCQENRDKEADGQNPIDNRLLGKWDVLSKTDSEEVRGVEKETDRDIYQPGEKTYEFTAENKLIITDGFGRHQTILPVWMLEGELYIGQYHTDKEPYALSFTENGLTMVKKEEERKEGEVIVQQEVVVLKRHL